MIAPDDFDDFEARFDALGHASDPTEAAAELLSLGEDVLIQWIRAHGFAPTTTRREGFRLLALHRQGAKGEPSFNACRETCRELVYFYNLITMDPGHRDAAKRLRLAAMVGKHLYLFVSGKMVADELGEFCCSSRPLRTQSR